MGAAERCLQHALRRPPHQLRRLSVRQRAPLERARRADAVARAASNRATNYSRGARMRVRGCHVLHALPHRVVRCLATGDAVADVSRRRVSSVGCRRRCGRMGYRGEDVVAGTAR